MSKQEIAPGSGLTKAQRFGIYGGIGGAVIGTTAWLIAMAGLSHDWLTVALTLSLDLAVLFLFASLCIRHGRSRFLYLALLIVILTAHCLVMYWWRLDLWRAALRLDESELLKQKKMVTLTVGCMVGILLAQLLFMHWLQKRSRGRTAQQ